MWGLPRVCNRLLSFLMAFFDARAPDPVLARMGALNGRHPAGIFRT
jgi:hypothetical protein